MNPFFSKARVTDHQDIIIKYVAKLCHRISSFAGSQEIMDLGAAATAVTRDIAYEYILGKNYDDLDQDDFNAAVVVAGQGSGSTWRLGKHVRWFIPFMQSLPKSWIMKIVDGAMQKFFEHLEVNNFEVCVLFLPFS